MKILNLTIKSQWYDLIETGVKKEEYREIKPYWEKRLLDYEALSKYFDENYDELMIKHFFFPNRPPIEDVCESFPRGFDAVRFHYGYTKKTMLFRCNGISIGKGNLEWGAPKEEVFIISLGEKLEEKEVSREITF